ncbi:hypothetical protein JCM8547_006468 [Rhodosporidiobolus lusitaniae]
MSNQVVGPLRASEPEPHEGVLQDALNLSLVVIKEHSDLNRTGFKHWRTRARPVLTGFAALAATLQVQGQANPVTPATESYKLMTSVIIPTEYMPIKIYICQEANNNANELELNQHLFEHMQQEHHISNGRHPRSPSRWTTTRAPHSSSSPLVDIPLSLHHLQDLPWLLRDPHGGVSPGSYFTPVTLTPAFPRDHDGHRLAIHFYIPAMHLLYFQILQAFAHSNNVGQRIAFLCLLILNEFGPFDTSPTVNRDFVDLYRSGNEQERNWFRAASLVLQNVDLRRAVRTQVNWHMQRQVTAAGEGMRWDRERLAQLYTRALSDGIYAIEPVEIYVPEVPSNEVQLSDSDSDGANAQAHLPHFDLWKRIEDKHNQLNALLLRIMPHELTFPSSGSLAPHARTLPSTFVKYNSASPISSIPKAILPSSASESQSIMSSSSTPAPPSSTRISTLAESPFSASSS